MNRLAGIGGVVLCAALAFAAPARAADPFVPTSSWLAGPASLAAADAGVKVPCVMINQYDNGYTFRISGGGGRILAMAIDFRQKAFKAGQSYRVDIEVPPYVDIALPGTAYNEATLIVNTQEVDGFYKNLSVGKTMKIGIGGSHMDFLLAGIDDGLSRIESCYQGGGAADSTVTAQGPVFMLKGDDAAKSPSAQPMQELITPMPEDAVPQVAQAPVAAAPPDETGSAVDTMLQAAAQEMKKVEPAAAPAAAVPVVSETKPEGQMLARSWASPFVQPDKDAAPRQIMASAEGVSTAAAPAMAQHSWRALGGTSLEQTLRVWAQESDVELMWMAEHDFSVVKPVSLQGSFESAVSNVLEQYEDDNPRPVGRLYNDSSAGKKVLLVELHRDY